MAPERGLESCPPERRPHPCAASPRERRSGSLAAGPVALRARRARARPCLPRRPSRRLTHRCVAFSPLAKRRARADLRLGDNVAAAADSPAPRYSSITGEEAAKPFATGIQSRRGALCDRAEEPTLPLSAGPRESSKSSRPHSSSVTAIVHCASPAEYDRTLGNSAAKHRTPRESRSVDERKYPRTGPQPSISARRELDARVRAECTRHRCSPRTRPIARDDYSKRIPLQSIDAPLRGNLSAFHLLSYSRPFRPPYTVLHNPR